MNFYISLDRLQHDIYIHRNLIIFTETLTKQNFDMNLSSLQFKSLDLV